MKFITGYVCYAVPLCQFETTQVNKTQNQTRNKPKVVKSKPKVTKKAPSKKKTSVARKKPTKKPKVTL